MPKNGKSNGAVVTHKVIHPQFTRTVSDRGETHYVPLGTKKPVVVRMPDPRGMLFGHRQQEHSSGNRNM